MKNLLKAFLAGTLGIMIISCSANNIVQNPDSFSSGSIYTARVSEEPGASISFSINSPPAPLLQVGNGLDRSAESGLSLSTSLKNHETVHNFQYEHTRHASASLSNHPSLFTTKANSGGTAPKTSADVEYYLIYLVKNSSATGYPANGDPLGTDLVAGPFTVNKNGSSTTVKFTNVQSSGTDAYYVAVRARDSSNNDLIKSGSWTGTTASTPGVAVSTGNGVTVNANLEVSSTTPLSVTANLLDGTGAVIQANGSINSKLNTPSASLLTYSYELSTLVNSGLYFPAGVAVDAAGNVYIADSGTSSIKKFDGTTTTTLVSGLSNPRGVAVDDAGNVYIAETGNSAIKKFDGTTTTTLVSGLNLPMALAVDDDGNLYIADSGNNTIKKFDGADTTILVSGLNTPTSVAVDKDGNIYIADTNNHQIKKFDGTTTTTLASYGLLNPSGVAVDAAGNVYIADTKPRQIKKFDGTTTTTLVSSGLFAPLGIAVDKDGNVYFSDTGNHQIKKLTKVLN